MTALNEKRAAMDLEAVRPYEVFDLIGARAQEGKSLRGISMMGQHLHLEGSLPYCLAV